jgi:hypothetical protein
MQSCSHRTLRAHRNFRPFLVREPEEVVVPRRCTVGCWLGHHNDQPVAELIPAVACYQLLGGKLNLKVEELGSVGQPKRGRGLLPLNR